MKTSHHSRRGIQRHLGPFSQVLQVCPARTLSSDSGLGLVHWAVILNYVRFQRFSGRRQGQPARLL